MVLLIASFRQFIPTRNGAAKLRELIEKYLDETDELIEFDFSEISVVSNSFVDECFGKLVEKYGIEFVRRRTTFSNVSPLVSSLIRTSIVRRNEETFTEVISKMDRSITVSKVKV